jgi:putative membrane protein
MSIAGPVQPLFEGAIMNKYLSATAACALFLLGTTAPLAAQTGGSQQQASSSTTKSSLSKSDQRYFAELAKANLAEIQAGKLALQKANAEAVKSYAKHMVDEHSKMLEEQRAMGQEKHAAMPAAPDDKQKKAFDKLQKLSGAEFDRAYMEQMVKDHEDALDLVKDIAKKADDPAFKSAGQKAVPDIQEHLATAKQVASQAKDTAKVSANK